MTKRKRDNQSEDNTKYRKISILTTHGLFQSIRVLVLNNALDARINTLADTVKTYKQAMIKLEYPKHPFPFETLHQLISDLNETPKNHVLATHLSKLLENVIEPLRQFHPKLNQMIVSVEETIAACSPQKKVEKSPELSI